MRRSTKAAFAVAGATLGLAYWWRTHPSACPYAQRFWVEAPHPLITRKRLLQILAPRPGETLLEIGPGTGYYTLAVADTVGPSGRLDILDLQQKMLDRTLDRARRCGIANIVSQQGDAQELPHPDATHDAAYLVATLGEIPDRARALGELRRVLKPNGRLVVGELIGDPHMVTLNRLRSEAAAVGLRYERRVGGRIGYFALLRAPE